MLFLDLSGDYMGIYDLLSCRFGGEYTFQVVYYIFHGLKNLLELTS